MDIFNLLLVDHARQRGLIKSILNTALDNRGRLELFEELRAELMAHAAAEEQTLYAELLVDAREQVQQSVTSNDKVAELAFQLYELDVGSSQWVATFTAFKAEVERHLDFEEAQLLPRARRLIKPSRAKRLGRRFEQTKLNELCLDGGCPPERHPVPALGQPAASTPNERQQRRLTFSSQTSSGGLRRRATSGGLSGEKGK